MATMGIGTGALVAGLFGMNVSETDRKPFLYWWTAQLPSHLEDDPIAFYIMTVLSSGAALLVAWAGFRRCVTFSMDLSKYWHEKDWRKFGKLGSLAITVTTPRNLIFPYRYESAMSRVGHTSTDTEMLIFGIAEFRQRPNKELPVRRFRENQPPSH